MAVSTAVCNAVCNTAVVNINSLNGFNGTYIYLLFYIFQKTQKQLKCQSIVLTQCVCMFITKRYKYVTITGWFAKYKNTE